MSRSQQVVDFIANLIPIYVPERYEDKNCARSLVDGTLVLPHLPEGEEDESNYSSIYNIKDCLHIFKLDEKDFMGRLYFGFILLKFPFLIYICLFYSFMLIFVVPFHLFSLLYSILLYK